MGKGSCCSFGTNEIDQILIFYPRSPDSWKEPKNDNNFDNKFIRRFQRMFILTKYKKEI